MNIVRVKAMCMVAFVCSVTITMYAYQDYSGHYGRGKHCIRINNDLNIFFSIQEAINKANNGDIILVPPGIYFENVIINKSISLVGNNPENTIIDGCGLGSVIHVIAGCAEISGFTIRNGFYGIYVNTSFVNITLNKIEDNNYGVYLNCVKFSRIYKNNITRNNVPIFLRTSHCNYIVNNVLFHNYGQAISLDNSNENVIIQNDIRNNPAFGIYLESSKNNTVSWNNIAYVCEGIHLQLSSDNLIARNIITNTGPYAIVLNFSDRNYVYGNSLSNNEIALQLSNARYNIVLANNITQSKLGLFISCAGNNTLRNNILSNNWPFGSFGVYGKKLEDFLNDVDFSNSVDGRKIYYLINRHNLRLFLEEAGYIALVNSSNIILENLNLSGNYQAITLAFSYNITLRNLQIVNNFQGIYLFCTNFSRITGSSFRGNLYNLYIHNSHFNLLFHNNFFDGKLLDSFRSRNFWDIGYPKGGNYWGTFVTQDRSMGHWQNLTGPDGICDFSHHLYGENVDRYPLAAPVKTFVTEFSEDPFVFISNFTILNFHFAPSEGPYILFNVDGPADMVGFCRVSVPKKLLWVSNSEWEVLINGHNISLTKIEDEDYVHLFFYFNHTTDTFMIRGTDVIPESSSQIFLLNIVLLFFAFFIIKVRIITQRFLETVKT